MVLASKSSKITKITSIYNCFVIQIIKNAFRRCVVIQRDRFTLSRISERLTAMLFEQPRRMTITFQVQHVINDDGKHQALMENTCAAKHSAAA